MLTNLTQEQIQAFERYKLINSKRYPSMKIVNLTNIRQNGKYVRATVVTDQYEYPIFYDPKRRGWKTQ